MVISPSFCQYKNIAFPLIFLYVTACNFQHNMAKFTTKKAQLGSHLTSRSCLPRTPHNFYVSPMKETPCVSKTSADQDYLASVFNFEMSSPAQDPSEENPVDTGPG